MNIGLVGLGFMGKMHFATYNKINQANVIYICTRNEVTDKEVLTNYSGSFLRCYDDLLEKDEIDIIDICLPTYLHEEYIIKAAQAGKHIFCEKPLTLSVESANRIINAVEKNGVRLFVGHILRFWSEYELIKSYHDTGQLNNIETIHAQRLSQFPTWSDWFKYPKKSGGALFDLHLHDIDFVYYLLGEVETVYAVGHRNNKGAWDQVMTTLTFKNNSKAFVEASQRMPEGYPFTMSFRVQTETDVLDLNVRAGENIENMNTSERDFNYYTEKKRIEIDVTQHDAFENELSYFINCIKYNKDNNVIPINDVFYTIKLLNAIKTSLKKDQL